MVAFTHAAVRPWRGGSPRALVRQAKLGVSCRVQVPAGEGLANHPYRVLRMCRRCNNTEQNIRSVHREPCRPQGKAHVPAVWYSLVRAFKQTATVLTHRKPTQQHRFWVRCWRVCRGPQGVACMERSVENLGDPGGSGAQQGVGKLSRPQEGRLKTFRESDQLTVLRDKQVEVRRKGLTA